MQIRSVTRCLLLNKLAHLLQSSTKCDFTMLIGADAGHISREKSPLESVATAWQWFKTWCYQQNVWWLELVHHQNRPLGHSSCWIAAKSRSITRPVLSPVDLKLSVALLAAWHPGCQWTVTTRNQWCENRVARSTWMGLWCEQYTTATCVQCSLY